jgi:cobalt-zinc-cadmium efflux system protein
VSAHHQHDDHTGHGHHHHHHNHHHHHAPSHFGRAFVIAIVLNSAFVLVEFVYGFLANSTALMADAGHNLSDVLGLALAWGASRLAARQPNQQYTYGLRSSSILAALANGMLLLLACGAIAWEAVHRLSSPAPVAAGLVIAVASVGIVINGLSAWLFSKGSKDDLNIRGAYLHMMADAAVSLGVVVSAVIVIYTGWQWVDPLVSLIVVAVIVTGTWRLFTQSAQLALNAVPANINFAAVHDYLATLPGVTAIHDLHIWGMSTTDSALTVHLVLPGGYPGDHFMDQTMLQLKEQFSIQHATLQVEQGTTSHQCSLHRAG